MKKQKTDGAPVQSAVTEQPAQTAEGTEATEGRAEETLTGAASEAAAKAPKKTRKKGAGQKKGYSENGATPDKADEQKPAPSDTPVPPQTEGEEGEERRTVVFEEALEAVLFAAGHPISYATLARVFEMTPAQVRDRVFQYSLQYNDPAIPRGVILLTYPDSCQLCTKQYYLHEIREALGLRRSGTLSSSSMEVLAIVAYNQPVTRVFVDTLRRADSSYAMNNLIDRGLIACQGRLDVPGRPMLFGTTNDFLRCFGLKDLSELPATSEEMLTTFARARAATEEQQSGEGEGDAELQVEELNEITDATQLSMTFGEGEEAPESAAEADSGNGTDAPHADGATEEPRDGAPVTDADSPETSAEDDVMSEDTETDPETDAADAHADRETAVADGVEAAEEGITASV